MDYDTIVNNVNTILKQYQGQLLTLRQIYYRLVADYGLRNVRNSYNYLSKILVKARERGDVDDTRIEDRSRDTVGGDFGFNSPEEYLDAKIAYFGKNDYTRSMWVDQPQYVEIWVEKDALSRVIARAADGFRIVVAPSRGYGSYTYLKRMAIDERFANVPSIDEVPKPIIILDFRDHDPSGIQMTEDLETRLKKYAEPGMDITVKRIALSIEQVRRYGLVNNPVKAADPRADSYYAQYGENCWELDAIPPDELTRIVRNAVQAEVDVEAWNETRERNEREQQEIEPILKKLADGVRQLRKRIEKE